jgi:hypothetical protein
VCEVSADCGTACRLVAAPLANPKAEAKANIHTIMIDPPSPFAALETWEQHLKEMQNLADSVEQKRDLIASAEDWIARKRRSS